MTSRKAMYAGLALTAAVAVVPLLDLATADTVSAHVREAYPRWSASDVAADRTAITVYLGLVGVLGAACWAWAIRAAGRSSRRARPLAVTLFATGTCLTLFDLGYGGEAYDRVIPLGYGLLGLLPCAAGLAAVILLYKERGGHGPSTGRTGTATAQGTH